MRHAPGTRHMTADRYDVLVALAEAPYFSTVRLADELRIEAGRTRDLVDGLDDAGLIARGDGLAWVLTAAGRVELRRQGRRRRLRQLLVPRARPLD